MIKSIRHKGLKQFWTRGRTQGLQQTHVSRITEQMNALDVAVDVQDMNIPGYSLHPLSGRDKGRWSIRVNKNWRLTFEFIDGDVYILDYEDYH
ncbi:type II toxin-antitoxin system RelE/ParE family toxin [uncultured Algimonas sp.]|uniref:type II toxin-antitoxin system RelE/ParE family toxin n=1 Tax=uncultured Algimonas sp. TaxID=1547920 RepID=UPI002623D80F|nr:type II toxin-antitoxin system RelE/ParE family toxin [uncultured Algimonas sp.]